MEYEHDAFRQFVEAVHDFSDEPDPLNVERYLLASQTLEESRMPARPQPDPLRQKENSR